MDSKKISIRPTLNLSSSIPIEDFQNRTLRPILKLQNELILQLFMFFCAKQKIDILNQKKEKFNNTVNTITRKNSAFRNQLLGLIIGQFTVEEFEFYKLNNSELNKRIITMIGQRIEDNQSEI
ncbi:glyoxalase [Tenacibaculum sp. nBUS_03]|uniref:glyoxalase n=1 Tax=Tenacibaculum sp. nBUS_03 TaxID=3395320 RepID=UPI003EBDF526